MDCNYIDYTDYIHCMHCMHCMKSMDSMRCIDRTKAQFNSASLQYIFRRKSLECKRGSAKKTWAVL